MSFEDTPRSLGESVRALLGARKKGDLVSLDASKMTEKEADIILAIDEAEREAEGFGLTLEIGSRYPYVTDKRGTTKIDRSGKAIRKDVSGEYRRGDYYKCLGPSGDDTGIYYFPWSENKSKIWKMYAFNFTKKQKEQIEAGSDLDAYRRAGGFDREVCFKSLHEALKAIKDASIIPYNRFDFASLNIFEHL
ncbi:hypothetical protein KKA13_04465 [Patescibacteria group bacterium]|nr:hypothetical protein [Patescibacteria group bacterium]MBU1613387.1 hypothetical protein [Patescibacteria group bacterium]